LNFLNKIDKIIFKILNINNKMSSLLLKIDNLIEGKVIKRPSQLIKTPYVADILPFGQESTVLAHTASLGCCGLADATATILMSPISKTNVKKDKLSCEYRVYLSLVREKCNELIVGIHPKLAEDLTESALKNNLLSRIPNVRTFKRETTIYVEGKVDSRFDFSGIDCNGVPFIMEVKNVPLADYEDITAKDRKKKCYDDFEYNSKVAYFPDGYRKKTTDTVSPRALKHIKELTLIKKESKTRCIMCYVIQRTDVNRFQPSIIDPEYREAFKEAVASGVEIITLVIQWTREGEAHFIRDDLPIAPL
jgi:DNA-binding sugar fermentation-stimulating protein